MILQFELFNLIAIYIWSSHLFCSCQISNKYGVQLNVFSQCYNTNKLTLVAKAVFHVIEIIIV